MLEEILTIYVKIEDAVNINGRTCDINMIRFTGYAESEYFKGEILPGGVDLQSCRTGENNQLSARYILEGYDIEGKRCRIFVENNGTEENGVIKTTPIIVTDSRALCWMETASLEGSITSKNGVVIIHICKCM